MFIFLSAFFQFYSVVCKDVKGHYSAGSLFWWLLLSPVVWPMLGDQFVSLNPRKLCASHSLGWIPGCAHICSYDQISLSCTIPSRPPYPPYRFKAYTLSVLRSFIMWLIVSSLSSHNLHLLFCCILSILALISPVLIALFCVAIRKDSVFLLRFHLSSPVLFCACKISLVRRLKSPFICLSSHVCFRVIFYFFIFFLCLCCQYRFWCL